MSVHTTIAVPGRERRRWPYVAAAVLLAAAGAAVLALLLTGQNGNDSNGSTGAAARAVQPGERYGRSTVATLMALTPAELAAGAFGTGYGLPSEQSGPSMTQVLASMSPETRRYTERIMRLTFAQLAAGAAGSP
jgi:hypothetical protein